MSRPELDKGFMINEGFADHLDGDLSGAEFDPKVIDDDTVKRLAALACNSLPFNELDSPSHIWISPVSLGIRGTDGAPAAWLEQEPADIYSYGGYDVKTATTLVVGSATSGATIEATRVGDDEWEAVFTDETGESLMYRNIFRHLGWASFWDLPKGEIVAGDIRPYDLPEAVYTVESQKAA
jgi:hypothetical protein